MATYNTVIKKRNDLNNGWDSILPITTAENVLVNEAGDTAASHISDTSIHTTQTEKNKLAAIKAGATKTEVSATNGNIKIDEVEKVVYTHPAGTNPHGTTKSDVGLGSVENKSSATIRGEITSSNVTTALTFTPENTAKKGAVNGYAGLDATGKVPAAQLPSYVDDVLEYNNLAGFPATGETGKIYVAKDTNITYRWSGTAYVEISASLALGETSSTAYPGDKGKAAYDHSLVGHAPSNAQKNSDITKAEIEAKLTGSITTHGHNDATTGASGYMSAVDKTKLNGIAAGAQVNTVTSVASKTGAVTLVKGDVGLGSVDNTADSAKNVLSATKLTTARTINGVSFNGTANITIADNTKLPTSHNTDVDAHSDIRSNIGTIQKQNILVENYLAAHNIPSNAKRGNLDVSLKGSTSVNLLGTIGNCDSLAGWSYAGVIDTTTKLFGTGSIKHATTNAQKYDVTDNVRTEAGKYYLASAYFYIESYTSGGISLNCYDSGTWNGSYLAAASAIIGRWQRIGLKFTRSTVSRILVGQSGIGTSVSYVDGVMVNEITADEYNNLTVDELLDKYPYHDGLQGATNIEVKSCGKNLSDTSKFLKDRMQYIPYGVPYFASGFTITNPIFVKGGDVLTVNGTRKFFADMNWKHTINGVPINWDTDNKSIEIPQGISGYMKFNISLNGNSLESTQIEFGAETSYEEYKGTEVTYKTLDNQPIALHKLPNGVCDEIIDGKLIKRIREYTLVASDILDIERGFSNADVIQIKKPTDHIGYDTKYHDINSILVSGYGNVIFTNVVTDQYKVSVESYTTIIALFTPKSLYTSLEQARTALAGTKMIYQLAQPQVLYTNATPLVAEPNGYVFVTSESSPQPNNVKLSYSIDNIAGAIDGMIEGQKELSNGQKAIIDELQNRTSTTFSHIQRGYLHMQGNNIDDTNLLEGNYLVINSVVNYPSSAMNNDWATLEVFRGGTGTIIQRLTNEPGNIILQRQFQGSVWRGWVKIVTESPTTPSNPVIINSSAPSDARALWAW